MRWRRPWTHKHLRPGSAMEETNHSQRAHGVEIEFVLGHLDDVVGDLLIFCKCVCGETINILDGVLPSRWRLRRCQRCHGGVYGELEIQASRDESFGGSDVTPLDVSGWRRRS